MNNRAKDIVACRWVALLVRQRCEPDFTHHAFGFWTKVPYEIQNRQIIESVEVKQIFRVHNGETFVVDEAARSEDVEPQMLVRMWSAFAIPLLADYRGVAVRVEDEPLVGRGEHISEDLPPDFRGNSQKRWI